jgi:hypothetical protein
MRKQRLIEGMNNSTRIRFIVDGVGMYCRISDVENFATYSAQQAVITALQNLQAHSRELAFATCKAQPTGWGTNSVFAGVQHNVQVDLLKD